MRSAILAAALILVSLNAALAQTAEQRAACSGDAQKFCKSVTPGGGRVLDCLAKQKDKLSDACKKVVAAQGK